MPSLELRLLPDVGEARAEETLTGRVEVRADQDVRCEALVLSLGWTASGMGNPHSAEVHRETLFTGDWRGGATTSYPFALRLPNGPVSFEGQNVRVRWWLEVQADIPWAIDKKAQVPLTLRAGTGLTPYEFGPDYTPPEVTETLSDSNKIAIGALGGLVGLAFGVAALVLFTGAMKLLAIVGFGVGAGMVLGVMRPAIQNQRAARILGPVDIQTQERVLRRGAPIPLLVRLKPPAPVRLLSARATILGTERAVSRSTSNQKQTVYELDFHEQSVDLDGVGAVEREAELRGTLTVPPDAAPSFSAPWNHVNWTIQVTIQAEGAPPWTGKLIIAVAG